MDHGDDETVELNAHSFDLAAVFQFEYNPVTDHECT
jgi:hypothetical protein